MRFEWDETKARRNLRDHGVSFEEAASVFGDPLALEIRDQQHSQLEERYIAMGYSCSGDCWSWYIRKRQKHFE